MRELLLQLLVGVLVGACAGSLAIAIERFCRGRRLFKAKTPEERRRNIALEMSIRDIERQREATMLRIVQRSGTHKILG